MTSPVFNPLVEPTSEELDFYEAPLLDLVGRSLIEMSDDELNAHIIKLRTLAQNPLTFRTQMADEEDEVCSKVTKTPRKRGPGKAKVDISALF